MTEAALPPTEPGPGFALVPAIRRNWRALLVCAVMAALWLAAAISLAGAGGLASGPGRSAAPAIAQARLQARAAEMSATQIRTDIAPESAVAINAAIPVVEGANPPAPPFSLANASAADRARSLECLTVAIYYESATEPTDGQRAVAQVVLNRVRHPAYPNTVCGVVFEGARRASGCQFSFTCGGALRRAPMPVYWERARAVAAAALNGYVYAPAGLALNYHANYVVPNWSATLVKSHVVGLHIFYRWRGGLGRPAAFTDAYAGAEPAIAWRGGFGQPLRPEAQAAVAISRDAQAAAAAEAAIMGTDPAAHASVDSFQRSVLRRYEPMQRERANAVITERTRADSSLTTSQRWALTGNSGASTQAPLGRRAPPPPELEGVRRRPSAATPAPADPTP
ncbi:MAG TPA: cell wall hydrolase [Allosphingosinicella sp.]|jgi:spore germination cell wall hydrolase CwlJ-like protein|nr:cell wall hydrolase [Allosphingosinicella sp.]